MTRAMITRRRPGSSARYYSRRGQKTMWGLISPRARYQSGDRGHDFAMPALLRGDALQGLWIAVVRLRSTRPGARIFPRLAWSDWFARPSAGVGAVFDSGARQLTNNDQFPPAS